LTVFYHVQVRWTQMHQALIDLQEQSQSQTLRD